jgi:hypothetical protein
MHEADIVEDAAWVVGAVAVQFVAVPVRDHCLCTSLLPARTSDRLSPPPGSRYRRRATFSEGMIAMASPYCRQDRHEFESMSFAFKERLNLIPGQGKETDDLSFNAFRIMAALVISYAAESLCTVMTPWPNTVSKIISGVSISYEEQQALNRVNEAFAQKH